MTPQPPAAEQHTSRFTYSLGGLMLLVTLISLHLALIVGVPCLGVPVAVLSVPAYVWSSLNLAKKRRDGVQVRLLDAIGSFVECFVCVVAIIPSTITAIALAVFLAVLLKDPFLEAAACVIKEGYGAVAFAVLAAIPALLLKHHVLEKRRRRAARWPMGSADDLGDST